MLLALVTMLGCRVSSDDVPSVPLIPAEPIEATPPTATTAQEHRLYQLLYTSEASDAAFEVGQRVRVRAWLAKAQFTTAELDGLRSTIRTVYETAAAEQETAVAYAEREREALVPIYLEMDARLATGTALTEQEGKAFADRLSAARASAYGNQPPAAARLERVRTLLKVTETWLRSLSDEKLANLLEARFFLVRRAHPLGNVGAYQQLVGLDWDGGQFAPLADSRGDVDQPQMDIGGLWSVERLRSAPEKYLVARQQQAVLIMAVAEPALLAALGLQDLAPLPETAANLTADLTTR